MDKPFSLSGDARQEIHDLSTQIDDVVSSVVPSSLDNDALLDLELNGLTSQLRSVIDHEVAAGGAHMTDAPVERKNEERR